MIRRPPRSPLFPYPPLSRSPRRRRRQARHARRRERREDEARHERCLHRSEEHTSELQSRLHLVCRLLLEKKKKTQRHLELLHRTLSDRSTRECKGAEQIGLT